MTEASDAYAEAKRLIAEAARSGATELYLRTFKSYALTKIPPEISTLTALTALDLRRTRVTDLSPLTQLTTLTSLFLIETHVTDLRPLTQLTALTTLDLTFTQVADLSPLIQLTALTTLDLSVTQVTDLSPITQLTALTTLDLSGTQVTDLAPITQLTALTTLDLTSTQVTDFTPITQLTALTALYLSATKVTELAPFTRLTALTSLGLSGTPVTDLRPLLTLTKLATDPQRGGLTFSETPACADPRIKKIADIVDHATRAQTLFDYLKDWVPPGEVADPVQGVEVPPRQPAPLETEILDDRLVVAVRSDPPLPAGPVDDRARKGWTILKQFRSDFAAALNIANYRPLASAVAAFDRAMGDSYDHLNEIAVGLAGERLSALSKDAAFVETLPEGAGTELASLGAAITTFAIRFPEWLAYLNDPADAVPVAATVQENIAAFTEIEKSLADSNDVAPAVLAEYRDELELVRASPHSEVTARALLASTRDLLRTLSENALIGLRLYGEGIIDTAGGAARRTNAAVIHEVTKFKELAPTEFRKYAYKSVANITIAVVIYKIGNLLTLAAAFPTQLGWIAAIALLMAAK